MANHMYKHPRVSKEKKVGKVTKKEYSRVFFKFVTFGAVVSALLIVLLVTSDASPPIAMAASPGINGKIAFASNRDGNNEIYVMEADGSNQTRLTNNNAQERMPAWSPDGTKIAFASNRDGNNEIYVMEADGSNQTRLTHTTVACDSSPSWSPDGTKLIYHSWCDNSESNIYMMEADGTNQTLLTSLEGGDLGIVAWSPDGTRIAFPYELDVIGFEIYLMDTDGSNMTRLTYDISGRICCPDWSPDGSKIAIADAYFPYAGDIYVINPDGTGLTILPNSTYPVFDTYPAWSPDGTKIAYQSSSGGDSDIYVMNADGSGRKNLTNNSADDIDPDWQPLSFINIDIKPGSDPNSINLRSLGVVPVAILTTEVFDATTVDPTSVIFAGASPLRWATEDVDLDGDIDLVFHFKTQELNLIENSTEAMLNGETFDGIPIEGSDLICIRPPD